MLYVLEMVFYLIATEDGTHNGGTILETNVKYKISSDPHQTEGTFMFDAESLHEKNIY